MNNHEKINAEFWKNTFIFYGMGESEIEQSLALISPRTVKFAAGETIYSPDSYFNEIGFVISGECTVGKLRGEDAPLPLNTLGKFDSFGILSLFSEEEYPTAVLAKRCSEIVFINKNQFLLLFKKVSAVAMNVLKFACDRISFLNDKISTFSADNVEQKVANHLVSKAKTAHSYELNLNLKRVAEEINVGRASLYRALERLSEERYIKMENKKIYIINPEGLGGKIK